MADFTSALYLGARRFTWPAGLALTTGRPAALLEPARHQWVAREVARRQGLETGLLAPSTLHLFWDILCLLPPRGVVLLDARMYPIGKWGSLRALLRGRPVYQFDADNPKQLARLLHTCRQQQQVPWLLTDGWQLAASRPAPLAWYLELLDPFPEAVLLLDDTQAFGLLGCQPGARQPLGQGGGGSLPFAGLSSNKVLTITSLAKGLGVPVAVLAGPAALLARYRQSSDVRVHTSPVSEVHAWAAEQALCHDARHGEAARRRLSARVVQFRRELGAGGIWPTGGIFPVQKLVLPRATAALGLYQQLRQRGVQALLLASAQQPAVPEVAFCLRADHSAADIRHATGWLLRIARTTDWFSSSSTPIHHEYDTPS
ncbi:aminotransferase class I/II-fold pyridoxal phosphate-dependent enzyme [Hymenobacter lucidus]|uniref:Aminotransferase class I/II-fold pyridoxal phosphate-dependent enzyme n=1 Tax=Hymenobacter lucidus TaxID=2880930 RepID=A0ABS8AWK2_9BACT|nr:aminotransferase class I/II-fold pyridoxal phosphate-dependent enzyme [Hymenobacter lucidus]